MSWEEIIELAVEPVQAPEHLSIGQGSENDFRERSREEEERNEKVNDRSNVSYALRSSKASNAVVDGADSWVGCNAREAGLGQADPLNPARSHVF